MWIVIVLVAVAAIVIFAMGIVQERKRRDALAAFARAMGWSFDPSSDYSHDDAFGCFGIFATGHSRRGFNTMTGWLECDGRRLAIRAGDFEYKVTSSNGKTTTTHTYRLSYLLFQLPFPDVPTLMIRPEGFMDKLAGLVGFDDIDFESAEFSKRFYVKSSDRKFAYAVVHPRMMEFLMDRPGPALELQRGHVCLSMGTRRWEPAEFRSTATWAVEFFRLWPSYLIADIESRARG